jgi:hypothetical protein
MPSGTNAGSIITMIAVIFFPLLIIPALLRFVPRPAPYQPLRVVPDV